MRNQESVNWGSGSRDRQRQNQVVLESKISKGLVIELMYRQKEETRTILRISKNDCKK